MELSNIENLIEKYFEGKTTLTEESALRKYFTTNKVPQHLEPYNELFGYFELKKLEVTQTPIKLPRPFKLPYRWLSIAAMLIFVLGVYMMSQRHTKPTQAQLLADYKTTQQALQLISKNINKGAFAMAQLQEFDKAKNKIFKK